MIWPDLRDRATRMAIVLLARDHKITQRVLAGFIGCSISRIAQIERRGRRALDPHYRWHQDYHELRRAIQDRMARYAGFWQDSAAAALAAPDMVALRRWLRRRKIDRDQAQYLAHCAGFLWAEIEWDNYAGPLKNHEVDITYQFDIEDELKAQFTAKPRRPRRPPPAAAQKHR